MHASIGEMIAASQAAEEQRRERLNDQLAERAKQLAVVGNPLVDNHMREGVRLTRVQRREKISKQARKQARKAANLIVMRRERLAQDKRTKVERKLYHNARAQRDEAIMFVLANTTTRNRKDGTRYMMAKPDMAKRVTAARSEASMVARYLRPKHGYPAPPPRREDSYPAGGLWGAPKGGISQAHVRAEGERLHTYRETVIASEGESERTERMLNHLLRLATRLQSMGSESLILRIGKHNYQMTTASR